MVDHKSNKTNMPCEGSVTSVQGEVKATCQPSFAVMGGKGVMEIALDSLLVHLRHSGRL